ncbi:ABC transporter permease subunit [Actinopolymorpha pittospori]
MTWVAWRQIRAVSFGLAAVTLGFTALAFLERTEHMSGMTRSLSIYLSLFVGALLGAPLLAQEFEHGTHRMAWTQGVTRGRWLAERYLVALVVALAAVHAVTIVVAEGGSPLVLPPPLDGLGTTGMVPYVRTVWMVSLGMLAGALTRRTIGAVAVTAVGWMATQFVLDTGLPRWVPRTWREDFWALQLSTATALAALSVLALLGTLLTLGLLRRTPRRRPALLESTS